MPRCLIADANIQRNFIFARAQAILLKIVGRNYQLLYLTPVRKLQLQVNKSLYFANFCSKTPNS
jgi:hypothetical protein